MKDKLKNYLIIALVILIGLLGFFGGRAVTKYRAENNALQIANSSLKLENEKYEAEKQALADTIVKKDARIAWLMAIFNAKNKEIYGLERRLSEALAQLNSVTADSSYQFLQRVAYNYPGALKYLFNELQIKYIHTDYLVARSSEEVIPILLSQIDNCKTQFEVRDSLATSLRKLTDQQQQQIVNWQKINDNNEKVIQNTEKQRDKEANRKNFWRTVSAVSTGIAVVLAVF